jgi:hypothetical protein
MAVDHIVTGAHWPDGNSDHRWLGVAAGYSIEAKNVEAAGDAAGDQHHRDRIKGRVWVYLNLVSHEFL